MAGKMTKQEAMPSHFLIKMGFALTDPLQISLFVLYQAFSLSLKGSS